MSDIERSELSKQLDDDLDRFIDNFAKQNLNKSKKPFVYDEWCKEIEQHPAFMTSLEPNDNGEFSEAIQALQALKYDDDELEDRRAAAERHKTDGNKYFKCKKYHWAINRYTDGINQRCTDRLLNSVLYANRAAAQKRIGNIGSAFRDCFFARKFDPENMKAIIRGAECLVELGRGKQCIDWLKSTKENHQEGVFIPYNHDHKSDFKYFNELYEKAERLVLVEERNERKRRRNVEKDLMAKQRLLMAFKERNIDFRPTICFDDPELFEWSQIDVQLSWLKESEAVYLDDNGILHWPILAQYPQIGKVDLVTDCSEENKEYDSAELMPWSRIRDIFSISGFAVVRGLPTVQVRFGYKAL
uniref:Cns1/TTC4 wheel domain-containing protein n=1 Tax=Setaria digitata TaxID=48799 RepID=A0A915PVA5_9BILA